MLALIASDNAPVASRLRAGLLEQGIDCPLTHVVSVDSALACVKRSEHVPDLVFVALSPDVDRALGLVEQIRLQTSVRLCAVGAANDPTQILRVVHAGLDDYLDQEGNLNEQIAALVKRLRMTSSGAQRRGSLVAVVSASGGSGRTTIVANLAVALAANGGTCAACDFNLRTGDLAAMFKVKASHSVVDLCGNLRHLDEEMFRKSLAPHSSGVHILAAPRRYSDVQQVTTEAAEAIAALACRLFPFVIVDLEDFFHREQFRLLQLSEVILLAMRLDYIALRNARRTLEYLERLGIPQDKFQLVVNHYGRGKDLPREVAEEALGRKISFLLPDEPKTVVAAANRGIPAMLESPRSKFCRGIKGIADRLTVPAL
jgi:pilus assembly protein CpaE